MRNIYSSLINILALSIAIAVFLLIFQYLKFELSYDKFHNEANQIYRVGVEKHGDKDISYEDAYTFPALGPSAKAEIPGVKDFFRLSPWANSYTVVYKNNQKNEDISLKIEQAIFADAAFSQYFKLDFLVGGNDTSLAKPNNLFISNSLAKKYFGTNWQKETNPVGEFLLVYTSNKDEIIPFKVSGIYKDMPSNSHLQYDIILSHSSLTNYLPKEIPEQIRSRIFEENWGNYSWYTYLVLDKGINPKDINNQINALVARKKNTENLSESFFLQPIKDIHLKSHLANEPSRNGYITNIQLLAGIGLLILLLAWANYTNLLIAKFFDRTKEIGIRKAIGSKKRQVIIRFFTETLMHNLIAIILALILSRILLPVLDRFTGYNLGSGIFYSPGIYSISILFGILFIGSFLASSYPSTIIASIKGVEALKNRNITVFNLNTKKHLLIFQFGISITLIMVTILIYKQISFMKHQDLKIDTQHIVILEGPNVLDGDINFEQTVQLLRNETASNPLIKQISATSTVPGEHNVLPRPLFRLSGENTNPKEVKEIQIDHNYFNLLDIKLLAGSHFSEISANNQQKVILNESSVYVLGFNSPEEAINKKIGYYWAGGKAECEIIGVVEDFHQRIVKYGKEPIAFYNEIYNGDYMVEIKEGQNTNSALTSLENIWGELFPNNPFSYYFLDNFFNKQYETDRKFGSIIGLFTVLGIFIACLGLLGLSIQAITQKTKEIGIRKVNGAKLQELLVMLNKDFVKWVVIAFIIATPVAWYAMRKWLENFAYKTNLSWWIFALAGAVALVIALITVSWQSWRAATKNPVEALRYE